jgi:hypothetical protein
MRRIGPSSWRDRPAATAKRIVLEVGRGPCTGSWPGDREAPWATRTRATVPYSPDSTNRAPRERKDRPGAGKAICTTATQASISRHDPTPPTRRCERPLTSASHHGVDRPRDVAAVIARTSPGAWLMWRSPSPNGTRPLPCGRSSGNRLRSIVKRTLPGSRPSCNRLHHDVARLSLRRSPLPAGTPARYPAEFLAGIEPRIARDRGLGYTPRTSSPSRARMDRRSASTGR